MGSQLLVVLLEPLLSTKSAMPMQNRLEVVKFAAEVYSGSDVFLKFG